MPSLAWQLIASIGLLMLAFAPPCGARPAGALAATWSLFQTALRANDPDAMARISRFPLESNDFGGPIASPTQLRERFGRIFTPAMRRCLLEQTPTTEIVEGRTFHDVFCEVDRHPVRFIFEPVESSVRWTAIDNIQE